MVLVGYWLALVIGTHIPRTPHVIMSLGTSDKVLHFSAYAGLALLVCLYWSLDRTFGVRQALGVVLLLSAFGAVDEVTQIPVGRECDRYDWLADVSGTLLGISIFLAARAIVRWSARRIR